MQPSRQRIRPATSTPWGGHPGGHCLLYRQRGRYRQRPDGQYSVYCRLRSRQSTAGRPAAERQVRPVLPGRRDLGPGGHRRPDEGLQRRHQRQDLHRHLRQEQREGGRRSPTSSRCPPASTKITTAHREWWGGQNSRHGPEACPPTTARRSTPLFPSRTTAQSPSRPASLRSPPSRS